MSESAMMTIASWREWLASWGEGSNWSDPSGKTVPITKAAFAELLDAAERAEKASALPPDLATLCEELERLEKRARMAVNDRDRQRLEVSLRWEARNALPTILTAIRTLQADLAAELERRKAEVATSRLHEARAEAAAKRAGELTAANAELREMTDRARKVGRL